MFVYILLSTNLHIIELKRSFRNYSSNASDREREKLIEIEQNRKTPKAIRPTHEHKYRSNTASGKPFVGKRFFFVSFRGDIDGMHTLTTSSGSNVIEFYVFGIFSLLLHDDMTSVGHFHEKYKRFMHTKKLLCCHKIDSVTQ